MELDPEMGGKLNSEVKQMSGGKDGVESMIVFWTQTIAEMAQTRIEVGKEGESQIIK